MNTEKREQHSLPYLPALDGIRAVAIIAVLLFHAWPPALRGGFTGVDVFFVLSGFLITSIVLRDIAGGLFSMREFYLRRIQRLLPNIVATVIFVLFLWIHIMPPGAAAPAAAHGTWALVNLSNLYVWLYLGAYWGSPAEAAPFTHTWSLGIEEQFYLFYPGLLLLLCWLQPARIRHWLLGAAVAGFLLCLFGTFTRPAATFYLLPTRLWELLVGGAVAAWRRAGTAGPRSPGKASAMAWAGLSIVAIGMVFIDQDNGFPGWVSLAPTAGTALLILGVLDSDTPVSRWLSRPFMVGTGKVSFSLYLWHWPLIILGKAVAASHGLPPLAGALAGALCGVLLGLGAYLLVERPLRNRGPGRALRLGTIAAGFCAAMVFCILVSRRKTEVDPLRRFDAPAFYGRLYDAGRPASLDPAGSPHYAGTFFPALPASLADSWRSGGILHPYGGGLPSVVVLGSSHALMYSRLIDDLCRRRGLSVAFLASDWGTPAFFEATQNPNFPTQADAQEFDATRLRLLRQWHPAAVFAIDRWELHAGHGDFAAQLHSFLAEVCPLAGRVLFVAETPDLDMDTSLNLHELAAWSMGGRAAPIRIVPDGGESVRKGTLADAVAAAAQFPNLRVLRADLPFYSADGSVRYADGRSLLYIDDNHLSDRGSEEVRGLFDEAIAEATRSVPANRFRPDNRKASVSEL